MNINIGPRGTLEIDNARIIFRNLEGRGGLYNREGDRSFALVVPDESVFDLPAAVVSIVLLFTE